MNRRLLSLLFISILQLTLLNFGVEAPFPRIHRKLANKPGDPDRYAVFLKPLITIAPRKIIKKIHDARDRLLQRLAEGDRSDNLIQWSRLKASDDEGEFSADSEIARRPSLRAESMPDLSNYRFTLRHSSRDPVTADKGSELLVEVDGQDIKEEVELFVLLRILQMPWLRASLKMLLLKKTLNLNDGISINGAGLCLQSERDSTNVELDIFFWINYEEAKIIVDFIDEIEKSISPLLHVYPILYVTGNQLKLIVFSNTLEYLGHTTVSKSYDRDSVNRPRKKQYLPWLRRGNKKAIVFDY